MNAIDENSLEGHGISAEYMYVGSLILALYVMQDSHG